MRIYWRKSSYSGSANDEMCVEVAGLETGVMIRDSRDPEGDSFSVKTGSFVELVRRIKDGTLDRP